MSEATSTLTVEHARLAEGKEAEGLEADCDRAVLGCCEALAGEAPETGSRGFGLWGKLANQLPRRADLADSLDALAGIERPGID